MTCKVLRTIEQNKMLDGVRSVCVGVSGGADSICLLDILLQLQDRFGYTLQVVHVNHGLRGEEAERDAAFVQAFCEDRGVLFHLVKADVASLAKTQKCSIEACGRAVRYQAFESIFCDAIAVAHTRTDSMETALFNLFRGSSLRGAAGIPAKRGKVIRPLIDCTRSEVEAYLLEHGLTHVRDSSNSSNEYSRNFIRNRVLEPARSRFPAVEDAFARFRNEALQIIDFMDLYADSLLKEAYTEDGHQAEVLLSAHPAVLHAALRILLDDFMEKQPEQKHILLCEEALRNGNDRVSIGTNLFFTVRQGLAYLESDEAIAPFSAEVMGLPVQIETPFGRYRFRLIQKDQFKQHAKRDLLDISAASGLLLRNRKAGDRFCFDPAGHSKTLKKLMNEKKIPSHTRDRLAVLCCGNSVAWVETIGASAAFRIKDGTQTALLIETERKRNNVI